MIPSRRRNFLILLILGLALLAGCEYLGYRVRGYDLLLPRPSTLLRFAKNDAAYLALASVYTLCKVFAGFFFGCTIATLLSFAGVMLPSMRPPVSRLALWSQIIPIPLLAPLLGLVVGYNLWSGVAVVTLICFFPVYLGWEQGQLALSADIALLARSYRPSPLSYIRHVLFPAGLPHALIGAKGAINLAILGATIAEFTGSGEGLGRLMLRGIRQLDPARSWGSLMILAIFSALMTYMVSCIQQLRRFSYAGGSNDIVAIA